MAQAEAPAQWSELQICLGAARSAGLEKGPETREPRPVGGVAPRLVTWLSGDGRGSAPLGTHPM